MATRFTLLCTLAAILMLPASAHAQAPSLSAPDMRPPQGTAPAGPACGMASVQHRDYADATGDSASAPDLGAIAVYVRGDCGVTISFQTALAAGQSLTVGINTDTNANTGLRDGSGADRILTVRDGQATLGIVDPAVRALPGRGGDDLPAHVERVPRRRPRGSSCAGACPPARAARRRPSGGNVRR